MGDPLIERAEAAVEFLGADSRLGELISTLANMIQEEWRSRPASPGAETGDLADAMAAALRAGINAWHSGIRPERETALNAMMDALHAWDRREDAPGAETVEQGPGWLSRRLARAVLDGAGGSEPARTFARLILGLPEPASSGKTGEPDPHRCVNEGGDGHECMACQGEACRKCGSGLSADVLLGKRPPCEHDVIERHQAPDPDLDRCLSCSEGVLDSRLGGMCGECETGSPPPAPAAPRGTFPGDLDRMPSGHTRHCEARKKWGDGECECGAAPRDAEAMTEEEPIDLDALLPFAPEIRPFFPIHEKCKEQLAALERDLSAARTRAEVAEQLLRDFTDASDSDRIAAAERERDEARSALSSERERVRALTEHLDAIEACRLNGMGLCRPCTDHWYAARDLLASPTPNAAAQAAEGDGK